MLWIIMSTVLVCQMKERVRVSENDSTYVSKHTDDQIPIFIFLFVFWNLQVSASYHLFILF